MARNMTIPTLFAHFQKGGGQYLLMPSLHRELHEHGWAVVVEYAPDNLRERLNVWMRLR